MTRLAAARATALLAACAALAGCATTAPPPPPPPSPAPTATAKIGPLHLSGDTPPAPPSVGPPGTVAHATYHVCLDPEGRVSNVKSAPGLAAVDEAAVTALRGWSWFVVSNDARPCFDVTLDLVVPAASHVVRQATSGVVAQLKKGAPPQLPPWVIATNAGKVVDAAYKVCVGDDGLVQSVRPLAPLVGGGDALAAALRASTWDVIVGPLAQAPYCFSAPIRIDLTRTTVPPPDAAPAVPFPSTAGHAAEPGKSIIMQRKLIGELPHLSDQLKIALAKAEVEKLVVIYRLCAGPDGAVARLEPVKPVPGDDPRFLEALRAWRFAMSGPPGVGFCETEKFNFAIHHGR